MRSRRVPGSPISLFSFQDVITSVTGVMILVVLLLIIEVVKSKTAFDLASPAGSVSSETAARDMDTRQDDLASLRTEFRRAQALIRELSREPEEIASQVDSTTAEVARLKKEAAQRRLLIEGLKEEHASLSQENANLETDNASLAEARKELRERAAKVSSSDQVRFIGTETTTKTPVLVECSGNGLKAKVLGAPPVVKSFDDPRSISVQSSIEAFSAWIAGLSRGRYAFVVLVKPSAAGYARSGVVEPLQERGFDTGYEPFEEGKDAVFEEVQRE